MATDASRPALLVAFAIMTIFLFFYLFFEVATDFNSFAKANLMLLWQFFLFLSASICEGCPVYVAGVAPVSGGVW